MDHEGKNDAEWVRKVQAGETEAFEFLVRRHEKTTFNLLYRWLGDYDEAAEAAQEVFLSAYRSIKQFRGESGFSTWLYRIAVNHAKNRRKSRSALQRRTVPLEATDPEGDGSRAIDPPHPGPDPAQQAEQNEVHDQVQQGINSLEADEAILILLHDFQELPYEKIAQILNIPIGTVRSRLHRARQALKARLTPFFHSAKVSK